MSIWSIVGFILVLYLFWRFLKSLGNDLPILELMLLISGLQWIIGPIFSYSSSVQHYKYYMYVGEDTYMSYVVPAFLLFTLILLSGKRYINTFHDEDFIKYSIYGKTILFIGVAFDILGNFAPPSLRFLFFLIAQLKFVGAGLLIFSQSRSDRFFFYGTLIFLIIRSIGSAMFHDLIIWGIFMFMLWALKNKPSLKVKFGFICVGILLGVAIQMVKAPFREAVWNGYKGDKLALFSDIIEERLDSGFLNQESNQEEMNVRLNQGWIISAIMNHTPEHQPFGKGSTIKEALSASLLPRFLDSDKKLANGRENFLQYTGVPLAPGTSMGLSIIGESYANFGVVGGIIFMMCWGWFLVQYWNAIVRFVTARPMLLFFIPVIFLQVIKAESEMLTVLNHLFKASLLIFLFYIFSTRILNWDWEISKPDSEDN